MTIARFPRSLGQDNLTLRLYRFLDLPTLFSLFRLEGTVRVERNDRGSFSSFLTFCRWLCTTFPMGYLIDVARNGEPQSIGFIGLYNLEVENHTTWLSLVICRPDERGRGYGRRALELFFHALQTSKLVNTVSVEISQANEPSLRLFRKVGFTLYRQTEETFVLQRQL